MGAAAIRRSRDVLRVAGPDARTYLQGQLSQDVDALAVGSAADTFVLQPTGKVEAWMRITRLADDAYLLDVDPGWGEAVLTRLTRFLLRTDCVVEAVAWQMVTVLDAETWEPPADGVALPVVWPGLLAVDLLGPSVDLPEGLVEADESTWEHRPADRESGSGLGLAIVRELVEAMDGEVRADASSDGGTVMVVRVPSVGEE